MLPPDKLPLATDSVGGHFSMIEAYKEDLDVWGNGARDVYRPLTKSLIQFLSEHTSLFSDLSKGTSLCWCDIGCGPGYFLRGLIKTYSETVLVPSSVYPQVYLSGVDVSPDCVLECNRLFTHPFETDFSVVDLNRLHEDGYIHGVSRPWEVSDVVSFIDVLYYLKSYRKTLEAVYRGMQVGSYLVIADSLIRHHYRSFPVNLPDCHLMGRWIDTSMPVREASLRGERTRRFLKYAVYRKLA